MASRTTTDPIEILLEIGVDLDNLSSEEDYLSALMEATTTSSFKQKEVVMNVLLSLEKKL